MRPILLLFAAIGSAAGQIYLNDLAPTGDGGEVYFTSALPLKDAPEAATGRIFRIGPQGLELYLERPRINPPSATGPGRLDFTNYFDLSRPQASRDGGVVAVTGGRICGGSLECADHTTLQTTVTGLPAGGKDCLSSLAGQL